MATPQSLSNGDLGLRLHLVGGAGGVTNLISGTYQAGVQASDSPLLSPQFYGGRGQVAMVSVAASFDAATAVTDMRIKLQGVPRPEFLTLFPTLFPLSGTLAGSGWVDILTLDHLGNKGTGATVAEHIYLASAGNTLFDTLIATEAYMFYQLQIAAECTGSATKAGDIAQAWVNIG